MQYVLKWYSNLSGETRSAIISIAAVAVAHLADLIASGAIHLDSYTAVAVGVLTWLTARLNDAAQNAAKSDDEGMPF